MPALLAGVDDAAKRLSSDGGARRRPGDHDHRHRAEDRGGDRRRPRRRVRRRHAFLDGGGMAKGAGMLAPGLATMLSVLTTDAHVDAHACRRGAAGRT